jgi:hypothetical protein
MIPDQLPGFLDEWIAPVRAARDESGQKLPGVWEKLHGGEWVRFRAGRDS